MKSNKVTINNSLKDIFLNVIQEAVPSILDMPDDAQIMYVIDSQYLATVNKNMIAETSYSVSCKFSSTQTTDNYALFLIQLYDNVTGNNILPIKVNFNGRIYNPRI